MRNSFVLAELLVLVAVCGVAAAGPINISIEDDGLGPVPKKVQASVFAAKLFGGNIRNCKLVGKSLRSMDVDRGRYYFVTTEPACWGSTIGPIILLKSNPEHVSVLFSEYGYSIKILDLGTLQSNLFTYDSVSGRERESQWVLKDGRYAKISGQH